MCLINLPLWFTHRGNTELYNTTQSEGIHIPDKLPVQLAQEGLNAYAKSMLKTCSSANWTCKTRWKHTEWGGYNCHHIYEGRPLL